MRKGKENLRPVYFVLIGIMAFMAGYMYRFWQEDSAAAASRPAEKRCGQTYLESDFLQEQLNARPVYILPTASAKKFGEYL